MKKYITPKTEKYNVNAQSILASSGNASSNPTPGFGGEGQTIGQGGMEAKHTTFTFQN